MKFEDLKFRWTYYPSRLLQKKCRKFADDEIDLAFEIGEHMKEMLSEVGGLGLAGNQAGLDLCLAIVAFPDSEGNFVDYKTLANPEIIFKSPNCVTQEEGCLSFPELYIDIERPYEIIVRGNLEEEGLINFKARGMLARILCHEIDHINGVMMIDHLSPLNREIIEPQLLKIEKEYGNTDVE